MINNYKIDFLNKPYWKKRSIDSNYNLDSKVGIIDDFPLENTVKNIEKLKDFSERKYKYKVCNTNFMRHTTLCSQIILTIAPKSKLYIAKIVNDETGEANMALLRKAITWLVDEGIKIINISMGYYNACKGDCETSMMIDAICKYENVIFVVSAGNSSKNNSHIYKYITCPGCSKSAITVGGLDKNLNIDQNMNLSGELLKNKPDVYENGVIKYNASPESFQIICGTSFSAPIVTGLISHYINNKNLMNKNDINSVKKFIKKFHI